MTRSYKVAVRTFGDRPNSDWGYNALRFATREAADDWGYGLSLRWTALKEYEVQESDEEPNR